MFKVKDRVIIKSYSLEKGFVLGEIVSIAKHPTMYKIEIDNPTDPHRYEWVWEEQLRQAVVLCA